MARAKRTIDKEEVDEIIYLKLKELGGMKKRLTYNSVLPSIKKLLIILNIKEKTESYLLCMDMISGLVVIITKIIMEDKE